MHKLINYICDELEELERKADKEGKLSMAEIQYGDILAHFKKNLLKSEEMAEEMEYSNADGEGNSYRTYRANISYAPGRGRGANARRDSMGRYSSNGYSMTGDEMVTELRGLMEDSNDPRTKQEFQKFIDKIERM